MPQITAIEKQEKNADRVSVFVDGRFALGLFADVAALTGLRVGQEMTAERLTEITRKETERKGVADALRLLGVRARSEKEISDRLKRKEYEDDIIVIVLERLRSYGYLDDADFAARWVASRGKSRGRRALSHELRQKGVDAETAAATLSEARDAETETESAFVAARKKVGDKPADISREAQAKLSAYLQRRGFGWDAIRPVLRHLYSASAADETEEE